jgi:hypothetical protein
LPYCQCPVCGQSFHLLVRENLEAWYQRWAPGSSTEDLVPVLCLSCWRDARRGALDIEALDLPAALKARLRSQAEDLAEPGAGST